MQATKGDREMHEYHERLPGYDPRQIWYDGCQECGLRAATLPRSLGTLDSDNYARALRRAVAWSHDEEVGRVSGNEAPLLNLLWAVHVAGERMQRAGYDAWGNKGVEV